MNNKRKDDNLKEKVKQALIATEKAISEDFDIQKNFDQNSKKLNFFNLENLNSESDFIKARAESDSAALKKKFSNNEIFNKNLPLISSCKALYSIAEKIRYETLGSKMLKGIQKNLENNYNQIIKLKRKDQLKNKEDVPIVEAFELYMLKKFHNIKLNSLAAQMLSFWEKDFENAIEEHIQFLKDNLEYQNEYSSKFSEILKEMEIFQNDENEETQEKNQDEGQKNQSNENEEKNSEDKKDQRKDEESGTNLDSD